MKLVCLTSSVLLAATTALAQEQPVAISVTTTDGHPMVNVRNLNTLPLEAFLLVVSPAETNQPMTHMLYDVHANYKHDTPIPPNASTDLPLPVLRVTSTGNANLPTSAVSNVPVPILCAVIFSDGTTWGDGACIQDLLSRRKALAACLQDVMALLQRIADQHLDREQAIAVLQQAWKERRLVTPVDDQVPNDQVFYSVTRTIQAHPSTDGTSQDFTKTALLLHHSYATWLADLEAAKPAKPRLEKSL
jgi:hypothetical protein